MYWYIGWGTPMKALKENLPWIAPTAAIVLLATGYIDLDNQTFFAGSDEPAVAAAPAAPIIREPVSALDAMAAAEPVVIAPSAPAQPASTAEQLNAIVAQTAQPTVTRTAPLTTSIAPEVESPVPTEVGGAVTGIGDDPAAFFAAAQANLAANDYCGEDLKALAAEARIYFPSGGLSAGDSGLAQARLLSKVLAECPGYIVQVEGHSDPSGDPQINLELSKQRAEAVVSRIASAGIDTSKLVAIGYGDQQPSNVRGNQEPEYYDRRVEFTVVEQENIQLASFSTTNTWQPAACIEDLSITADQTKVFYAPRSITVPSSDLTSVMQLAVDVANCDGAKLRIIGQHSAEAGLRESVTTGRHRALAIMNTLVATGVKSDEIMISAPSWSQAIPNQPGLPNSRVDFQVVATGG